MSLVATIQSAIDTAFVAIGDLAGDFTLRRKATVFDYTTSDYTETVTDYIGKGIIDKDVDKPQDDSLVTEGQTKIWLKINQKPLLTDVIIMPDAVERNIIKVTPLGTYNTVFIYECLLSS